MICVCSHDAGGAEILASYVAKHSLKCYFVLAGPAIKIFQKKLGKIDLTEMDDAIYRSDWLICSTSWQSNLEWDAIGVARRCSKKVITFLDHWGHYEEGFRRDEELRLPDEIWVGDLEAKSLALKCFPKIPVKFVANPYLEEIGLEIHAREADASINRAKSKNGLNILFVSEPLADHGVQGFGDAMYWGYTEDQALQYFHSNKHVLGSSINRVVVRPHPSESKQKYRWVSDSFGRQYIVSQEKSLIDDILESDVVVGLQSMALVIALIAGRKVVSCIPPGGVPCCLPHKEIQSMQELIKKYGHA